MSDHLKLGNETLTECCPQGDTLLQRTTMFLNYLLLFFRFLDKAVLLSLTTFPFILNVLTSLGIAFIHKVETF